MSSETDCPHVGQDVCQSRRRCLASMIVAVGVLIAVAPSLYILYHLVDMWWTLATMPNPPATIRPMGFTGAMCAATGIGLIVCGPICLLLGWAAHRLGSEFGLACAMSGIALGALPWVPRLVGLLLMCYFTGVQLGS
jgi:hypothetical protein